MKKLVVDCSKPLGQQETVVDMPEEEKAALAAVHAENEEQKKKPKPLTAEERIAALEAKLAELEAKQG